MKKRGCSTRNLFVHTGPMHLYPLSFSSYLFLQGLDFMVLNFTVSPKNKFSFDTVFPRLYYYILLADQGYSFAVLFVLTALNVR